MLHSLKRSKHYSEAAQSKIIDPERLPLLVQELKKRQKTIASLNGSFDLLHAGHLEIIYQAALQADLLIVGLNSDLSIKQYKSPERPIVPLEYRLQMMAALEMVDYVTWFEETDPRKWLTLVKPDVHVNGAEYGFNCIEADIVRDLGARLHIVSLVEGLSTSKIINKIQSLCV